MSVFHENIKQIFAEVEKFLNETLKKEKLGKKALEHKVLILEKLASFLEENPSMKHVPSSDTISIGDDSTMTGGSSKSDESEEAYIDAGLSLVGVGDLADPVFAGFLEKKQKKGSGLFGSSKFQTRWCVIHGGNFYYFAKQDDKRQHGSFRMEGYKFRSAPDLASKKKEKDLCFEIYHPSDEKKRIYQFMAKSPEDLAQWQQYVESGGYQLIEEDIYEEVGPESSLPKATIKAEAPAKPAVKPAEEPEDSGQDVYEDPDVQSPPPVHTLPQALKNLAPPPVPSTPSDSLPPPPPPPISRSPVVTHKPTKPAEPDTPVEEIPEDIYDDTALAPVAVKSPPPVPGRHLPPPPEVPPSTPPSVPGRPPKRGLPELPPVPVPKKRVNIKITCKPEEDFENKFYGKWDCMGDSDAELSFKRGDMIHILSQEFNEKSWWVGELNGKFGLVPKNFLVPAYTLISG